MPIKLIVEAETSEAFFNLLDGLLERLQDQVAGDGDEDDDEGEGEGEDD